MAVRLISELTRPVCTVPLRVNAKLSRVSAIHISPNSIKRQRSNFHQHFAIPSHDRDSAVRPMPSSSVVKDTACTSGSAKALVIKILCPASGTYANCVTPAILSDS